MKGLKKVTFKQFVRRAHEAKLFEGTPEGDFISEAALDFDFLGFRTEYQLADYLRNKQRCLEAVHAATNIFKIWKISHGRMMMMSHD